MYTHFHISGVGFACTHIPVARYYYLELLFNIIANVETIEMFLLCSKESEITHYSFPGTWAILITLYLFACLL